MATFIHGIHLTWKDGKKTFETFMSASTDQFLITADPKTGQHKFYLTRRVRNIPSVYDISKDEEARVRRAIQEGGSQDG